MLVLGEIRTCLLRNSVDLRQTVVAELLELIPGELVWISERPVAHAMSPDVVRGVDCSLPTGSGARCRGVGTVQAHALVAAGQVLQGSVLARVDRSASARREPWSHYLSRPGVVEVIGRGDVDDVARGFVAARPTPGALDLGAVGERLIGRLQTSPLLDHVIPFRTARTSVRVAVTTTADPATYSCRFTVLDDRSRTMVLRVAETDLHASVRFCEDVALHDWLLTAVLRIVGRGGLGSGSGRDVLGRLRPVIDSLMHVWMPGAHVPESMAPFWDALERRPGFTRQWQATVNRVRDQLAMRMLTAFYDGTAVRQG